MKSFTGSNCGAQTLEAVRNIPCYSVIPNLELRQLGSLPVRTSPCLAGRNVNSSSESRDLGTPWQVKPTVPLV